MIRIIHISDSSHAASSGEFKFKSFHGKFSSSPVVEAGIPASEHILIVKSCNCLDNAKDKSGNEYYFYMVDHHNELKALITASKLDPFQKLDDNTRDFCEIVKIEIAKDGGIEKLIKKFKTCDKSQCMSE